MRRINASVSVVLALTITMILSFCLLLIESAREKTLLLKADIIFHACVNSVMAEFHQELWETYDVFYIDASYHAQFPDYELVKNRLKYYADENLKYDKSGWLSLSYEGATISEVTLATDNAGFDFYQKAIEAAKFSNGISMMEEVILYLDAIEEHIEFGATFSKNQINISKQIEEANGTEVVVKDAVWGVDENGSPIIIEEAKTEVIEIENPLDKMQSGNLLLKRIIGEDVSFSQKHVNISEAPSKRTLAVGNVRDSGAESTLIDKAMYCTYIKGHFGNYLNPLEGKALSYEMEYIISGKESDVQNMEALVARLLLIREVDNYFSLLSDEAKNLEAHALAATAASIATWLEPIVYQAILIYWAYEMSIEELQSLFAGKKIPLCKSLLETQISLDYQEYLSLLFMLQQRETLTMHSIDVIEFSVRQREPYFRMDGCLATATMDGGFQDIYKKHYGITKTLQYY